MPCELKTRQKNKMGNQTHQQTHAKNNSIKKQKHVSFENRRQKYIENCTI